MKLLHKKSQAQNLVTLPPTATVEAAAQLMSQKLVGSVLVMDGPDKLSGIFTERDLMKRVVAAGLDPKKTAVSQVMTREVSSVDIGDTLEDCYDKMQKARSRHMPIVDGAKVVGMVTMRDLLQWLWQEIEEENLQLKHYIQQS